MPEAGVSFYEQDIELINRFLAGESQTAIARNLRLTRERVRQRLKRNGFSGRNNRWIPTREDLLIALQDSNSLAHATELLGLSELQLQTAIDYHALSDIYLEARNRWRTQRRQEYYLARQRPLISQIRGLALRLGHTPTQKELKNNTISHMTLIRTFGSLSTAMRAAGLIPNLPHIVSALPHDFNDMSELTTERDIAYRKANLLLLTSDVVPEPDGVDIPQRVDRVSSVFYRDPRVVAWVLQAANGSCELCGIPGYETDLGNLYLEIHHVVPLMRGGPDKVSNAVAVCEICHGKLHRAKNRDELKTSLYTNIERLIEIQE